MGFWEAIEQQLTELRTAKTADEVIRILGGSENAGSGDAFFAGGGGDGRVSDSLESAGWEFVWRDAWYYYVMAAPNGDMITYVEGDVYKGDQSIRA